MLKKIYSELEILRNFYEFCVDSSDENGAQICAEQIAVFEWALKYATARA